MSVCAFSSPRRGMFKLGCGVACLALVLFVLASSGVTADKEVDSDLVFEDSLARDLERSSEGVRHKRESIHLHNDHQKDSHWISRTVHRIKRGFFDFLNFKDSEESTHKPEEDKPHVREVRSSQEDYADETHNHSIPPEEDDNDLVEKDDTEAFNEIGNVLPAHRSQKQVFNDDEDANNFESGDGRLPEGSGVHNAPGQPSYYRLTLTIAEPYDEPYANKNSEAFKTLANILQEHMNDLFESLPGRQSATVIRIQKGTTDVFTCLVTIDIGSIDYYDSEAIKSRIYDQIRNYQRIGSIPVVFEDFTFRKFSDTHVRVGECAEHEMPCHSGECVHYQARCNGTKECADGSDEMGCTPFGGSEDTTDLPDPIEETTTPELPKVPHEEHSISHSHNVPLQGSSHVIPVTFPASASRCRADDQIRCDYSPSVFICEDQKCDGNPDCPDGEDERNCDEDECATGEFMCDVSRCIPDSKVCDGVKDCDDGTDESCPAPACSDHEFRCNDGRCISSERKCDKISDCAEGEDEKGCPRSCAHYEFRCNDGTCIDQILRCNMKVDCPDKSDEHGCQACSSDQFRCNDGSCLSLDKRCDGTNDCVHGEDEELCAECSKYEFRCDNGICIDVNKRCDGSYDCFDSSDEKDCELTCRTDQFRCNDGTCIQHGYKCDGVPDCPDHSDELEANCPQPTEVPCEPDDIRCGDGMCVPKSARCDNIFDCVDGVDERDCALCSPDQYKCESGQCISENKRCDGHPDCGDGSDERDCTSTCRHNEFRCGDGLCLDSRRRCDGYPDCKDQSDEHNCHQPTPCRSDQFQCHNGICVTESFRCDGFEDCTDGSDEHGCTPRCSLDEFECSDRNCISNSRRCDGRADCPDGGDEHDCPPRTCRGHEFSCGDGHCIPRDFVCDRHMHCRDGSDERDCGCQQSEFTCNSGECISITVRCDGHADCYDGSDEHNCPTTTQRPESWTTPRPSCSYNEWKCNSGECIPHSARCDNRYDCNDYSDESGCSPSEGGLNLKTYPDDQIIKENVVRQGREVVFQCRDEGPLRARVHWVRGNNLPLPPGSRDINGRLEMPDIQVEHTGTYICEAVGYPSNTPGGRVTVSLTVEPFEHPTNAPNKACELHEATCSNGDCIPKSKVCDGTFDCTDGSDETRCNQHGCEPNEFRCANKRCVLKTWRCDSDDDCGDGSDEQNCSTNPPGSPCRFHEYQCRSGNQCIPKSFHCDMERDCIDGSDEIGCSNVHIHTPPPPMITLEIGSLFEVTCRAVGVPTPEVIWRLNWGHIPEKCTTTSIDGLGTLTCPNIQEHDQGAYSCEAINIRGSVFAVPDTILTVKRPGKICPPGYFNDEARDPSECISCFCFGATTQCESADLFTYQLHPPFESHKVIGVKLDQSSSGIEIRDEPMYRGTQPRIQPLGHSGVQVQTSPYSKSEDNIIPYFAMPENYHGNQLKSYGGYLKYNIKYSGAGSPNTVPDVILSGNGYTLAHISHPLQAGREHPQTVRFFVGEWVKRQPNEPEKMATREEIMMALASVDNILIKLQYTSSAQIDTTISNIEMDSAAIRNTGLGRAHFVEECKCPVGYTGLSCENCAVGYTRHMSGPWLGKCYKEEETCQPGTYGDPSRGIACEICPCPLTNPSNQFARTCHLGTDGNPTCDCPPGYVGRRCEQCAAGYTGNPLVPGDSCQAGICDPAGSLSLIPDASGECPCKEFTTGPTCNQCKPNKFNLSPINQLGCVSCFCMGVTEQCTSSNWYRDTIGTAFTRTRNDFKLVDSLKKNEFIEDGITLKPDTREIVYDEFSIRKPVAYYWSLPSRYLGDKITSYGGHLNYTLRYVPAHSGQMSRNTAPDVEIISENDIILMYFRKDHPQPNIPQSYSVPLLEQHWQRSDGKQADREHLLMALADLKAILIKATYTTSTREVALSHVSLDIADERNTGRERALEVEQCQCPVGYRGLSCEDCDFGYTRNGDGLYLGLCGPCNCNGHSSECDPETGTCSNCGDHTTGDFCDVCVDGYEGDATQGTPYDCRPRDPSSHICDCNVAGSTSSECYGGQCRCKSNVEGNYCDRCRKGTFGLSESNSEGCSECFCSGVTDQCGESNLFREQIPSQIIDASHGFTLTDQFQREHIKEPFQVNVALNEIGYMVRPSKMKRLFWSLPSSFTGDKITSYGGRLEFTQRYTERPGARHDLDMDVILSGNGVTVYWTNPERLIPDRPNNVSVIISTSENWQRFEQHTGPRRASRDDILTALSNLDVILIRATQSSDTSSTYISDITLDTAVPQYTGQQRAIQVENCKCPVGYRGTSCELCATGYYRDVNDKSVGPLGSCQRCPCSSSEQSCALGHDNRVICNCLPGYYGDRCETTDIPTTEYPYEPSTPAPPTIEVSISAPTIQIIDAGSTLRLHCYGKSLISAPVQLRWSKLEGILPRDRAIDDRSGLLIITSVHVSDSGTYICQASDGQSVVTGSVSVTVGGNPPEAPRVTFEPSHLSVTEGDPIEIRCVASGNPRPSLEWTADGGRRLNPEHTFSNGIFRIQYARKSDEGQYTCSARNSAGIDARTTIIYVREGYTPPAEIMSLEINPKYYTGPVGQQFTLTCTAASTTVRSLMWSKLGGSIPYSSSQRNGVLTVYSAKPEDSGTYICNGTSYTGKSGYAEVQVRIDTESSPPTARIEPDRQTVAQGTTAELHCMASGTPAPTVKWTKVGEEFGPNVQVTGQYLRISNIQVRDRGVYVCIVQNEGGRNQASTIIEVEQREPPAIELYPSAHQTITTGGSTLLQCRVTSGIPQPKVTWTRSHGLSFTRSVEELPGGVLRFSQITMEDAGEYICHAENEAGSTSATAKVEVQSLPVIRITPQAGSFHVKEGDRVRLECHASGHPSPSVTWSKYDAYSSSPRVLQDQQRAVYEITRVSRNDQGVYTCLAKNAAGVSEDRVQLIVEEKDSLPERGDITGEDPEFAPTTYRPYGPTYPERNPIEEEFVVPVGGKARLRCNVQTSYPDQIYFNWIKSDNTSLPVDSTVQDGTLIINNADSSAAGEYACVGISVSGNVLFSHKARLRITAPPRIILSPPRQVVRPGDNAHISCTATGDQPIEVSWSAMDRPLSRSVQTSGGELQFYGIQTSDEGRYICTAKNSAGEADAVAEVIVNENPQGPAITAENKVQNVLVGSTAQLRCRLSSYSSVKPTIHWTRDRQALPPNAIVRGDVLQLIDIKMQDAGRYICEVSNEYGRSQDYITLVVNPHGVRCHPNEFECQSGECIPMVRVCDRRRDCRDASDEYCYRPRRDPHREPQRASMTIQASSDRHHISDTLDLHCHSSEPGAEIKWSKLSGRLADNVHINGPSMRIHSLRPENEGYYRCEAHGYHGVETKDYDIVLIDAPHADERPLEIKRAPQGSTITMNCHTDLQAPVTYQWTKQGGSLPHDTNTESARLHLTDISARDAGTYICTASNSQRTIDVPTVLVITGIVPFFSQAPSSYISLPTLSDGYLNFNFEVSFKPETPNGIIVYNGQKKNSPNGDFISLVLNDGIPEFRFNAGSGPAIIRGDKRLALSQWHTIKVIRTRRTGKMFVDGQDPYVGQSGGKNQGLNLVEPLYIGGVPNFNEISPDAGSRDGFVGCISRLVIGRAPQDLMRDAINKMGITTCETCSVNPCQNQGVCQEAQTKEGHICLCPAGFSGATCSRVGEACYPDVCGSGRCVDKEDGFDCYCPLGTTGKRCEREVQIYEPAFANNAYIAYPTPSPQRRLKMNLKIKPRNLKDGVLLYCGESEEGYGHFTSLALKDKHLEFRFDTGAGPAVIRSNKELKSNEWVAVTVSRYLGEGRLIVNGESPVSGKSPGGHKPLSLHTPLYVGGYDADRINLNPGVGVTGGFDGCISAIDISGANLNLTTSAMDSANVQDCSDSNFDEQNSHNNDIDYSQEYENHPLSPRFGSHLTGCNSSPCRNDGRCLPITTTEYTCSCINGYSGRDCEIAPNLCDQLIPCQNGGTCHGNTTKYKCDCPIGYNGLNCEQRADIRNDVQFSGDGYIELSRSLLPHEKPDESELIALVISTNKSDGLIFWHGQGKNENGSGQDFISLAVVGGYLEFTFDLGTGAAKIRNEQVRVDDGQRHSIILKRQETQGSIEIDGDYTEFGQAGGFTTTMNCDGNIYLGGLPNIELMTGGMFSQGFEGCIHGFEVQDSNTMDLSAKALYGVNVKPCSSSEHHEDEENEDDFVNK